MSIPYGVYKQAIGHTVSEINQLNEEKIELLNILEEILDAVFLDSNQEYAIDVEESDVIERAQQLVARLGGKK